MPSTVSSARVGRVLEHGQARTSTRQPMKTFTRLPSYSCTMSSTVKTVSLSHTWSTCWGRGHAGSWKDWDRLAARNLLARSETCYIHVRASSQGSERTCECSARPPVSSRRGSLTSCISFQYCVPFTNIGRTVNNRQHSCRSNRFVRPGPTSSAVSTRARGRLATDAGRDLVVLIEKGFCCNNSTT
jgi:hypothetical protein